MNDDSVLRQFDNSDYQKNQQKREKGYKEQINKMKEEIQNYHKDQSKQAEIQQIIKSKKSQIILSTNKVFAHFNFDMFKVACELLDFPDYQNKPVALKENEIISSVNYVARKLKVSTQLPVFIAEKLCPRIVILPSHPDKYQNVSKIFMAILKQYDPELEMKNKVTGKASIDLTKYISFNKITDISQLCESIRDKIFQSTHLTVSCGVGPNNFVAKLAEKKNKPNGLFIVPQNEKGVQRFIAELAVRSITGVGEKIEFVLKGLDINICQNIIDRADELYIAFQSQNESKLFDKIYESCFGYSRNVEISDRQSVSRERTFSPTSDLVELESQLTEIAQILSQDLQNQGRVGSRLTLTIKTFQFKQKKKSKQLPGHINESFIEYGRELLKNLLPYRPIRLIGLKMDQLKNQSDLQKKHEIKQFGNLQDQPRIQQQQQQNNTVQQPQFTICLFCDDELKTQDNVNEHLDNCALNQVKIHFGPELVKKIKKQ